MSKTRIRTFKRYNITDKKIIKIVRPTLRALPKCNMRFGYASIAQNLNLNYELLVPKFFNVGILS